jgi:hypothetical protein
VSKIDVRRKIFAVESVYYWGVRWVVRRRMKDVRELDDWLINLAIFHEKKKRRKKKR